MLSVASLQCFHFYLEQGQELCVYSVAFRKSVTSLHYNFLDSLRNKKTGEKIVVLFTALDQELKEVYATKI